VLLNQLNMAACIDLIFSMLSPIDPICALGYKKNCIRQLLFYL